MCILIGIEKRYSFRHRKQLTHHILCLCVSNSDIRSIRFAYGCDANKQCNQQISHSPSPLFLHPSPSTMSVFRFFFEYSAAHHWYKMQTTIVEFAQFSHSVNLPSGTSSEMQYLLTKKLLSISRVEYFDR